MTFAEIAEIPKRAPRRELTGNPPCKFTHETSNPPPARAFASEVPASGNFRLYLIIEGYRLIGLKKVPILLLKAETRLITMYFAIEPLGALYVGSRVCSPLLQKTTRANSSLCSRFSECSCISFPFPRCPAALIRFHELLQWRASALPPLAFLRGLLAPFWGKS